MGSADCEPISELCRYPALSKAVDFGPSFLPPSWGRFFWAKKNPPVVVGAISRVQTHNAARAEYDRSAALRIYSRALKSPSGDVSARCVPRFNDRTRLGVTCRVRRRATSVEPSKTSMTRFADRALRHTFVFGPAFNRHSYFF